MLHHLQPLWLRGWLGSYRFGEGADAGGSCQKVSGVPSVPCPAAGPCPCCLHQAVPELQQMHLHPMPGCPIRAVVCGDIAHLELILMPVVDLRAGDTTWVSSASTDWRRLSFTMYWLLLVGCHSTPKILKKEKKGEKKCNLFSLPLSPGDLSPLY